MAMCAADMAGLQGGVEDRWAAQQAARVADEAAKQAEAEALTKKQRIALQVR